MYVFHEKRNSARIGILNEKADDLTRRRLAPAMNRTIIHAFYASNK